MAATSTLALLLASFIAVCYSQGGFSFDGGEYKCDGHETCAGVTDEQLVDKLICTGYCACCGSTFVFPCNSEDCSIECEEEDSCAALTITMDNVTEVYCGEARSCAVSTFALIGNDGFKFECSDEEACANAQITAELASADPLIHMDEFQCDGERTCASAEVLLERLEKLSCEGYRSCDSAQIAISNPAAGFAVQCEGDSSCQGGQFTFSYTADAADLDIASIECESSQACQDSTFTIENNSAGTVVIDELKCEGFEACNYINFDVTGSVQITKCICEQPDGYTCSCTDGLDAICQTFEGTWTSSSSIYACI